ncbi:hypothetical protein BP6252_09909 [Coleophoma cylindrospora]|uniref:Cell cycle control protein cwf19 n=1 Tax=Coleophoma cylindrospora TaxID=1849047 RepID=A0A3D8QXL3_9HELO|nr:hypothetical protein BP6252_09909 [Coleophoma cylindrospora]
MDGLDEFEKTLAAEKALREKSEKDKDRKHKHRHRHHRSRHEDEREHHHDGHRDKRSRQFRDDEDEDRRRSRKHAKVSDPKEDLPIPDEEAPASPAPVRDSWMTEPSALDIDYTQKGVKKERPAPPKKADYDLKIHKNELNAHLQDLADGKKLEDISDGEDTEEVSYIFGDSGSQWRMTRLKAVYKQSEQSSKPIEEVAIERFGSIKEFDDAREEEIEMDRRKLYGKGYVGKEKPSGELFQARNLDLDIRKGHEHARGSIPELPQGLVMEQEPPRTVAIDQTGLNRLKAQLMKAKLRGSLDVPRLEAEYEKAAAGFVPSTQPDMVVLGAMENRMLAGTRGEVKAIDNKRGRERGLVEENEDMSIEDMVREERRTRGQAGGEGMRAAERIAKDGKFDTDLDYMDDNANKLAKRVQKSEINLKNAAVSDFQKMNRILDNCQLCHHEEKNELPIAPLISLATRVYLTLPTEPELSEGGAVIVPIQHRTNLLECDDDEWEEIRNFMKSLTRMYHDQGRDVVFYENAAAPHRKMHAAMQVVPLPYSLGETAPAFFREAILSSDEEWTQHKKLIDTAAKARDGLGKSAFRRTLAKEMPYFHAWFTLDGGLGHIVEDSNRWPKGDLFAREIIGGMLDVEPDVIKRQGRWHRGADRRLEGFRKRWRKFDWTRVLTDG